MKHCELIGLLLKECVFAGEVSEAEFRATDFEGQIPARHDMLDGVDLSKTSLRWVEIYGQNLKGTIFPDDTDHLVVGNYRCFLETLLSETASVQGPGSHFVGVTVPKMLRNLGPEQQVGLFNLQDWFGSWDEEGQIAMRAAFETAGKKCGSY
jgi:hypothetical protein